ncbi:MAG: energy transducer TonB, partial [Ignavibacteriaceae bacterium]
MKKLFLLVSGMLVLSGCAGIELTQPVVREKVEPVYPYEAKIKGVEGKVEIFLMVNESGDVETVKMSKSSGSEILDNASIEYGKRLKFEPAQLKG